MARLDDRRNDQLRSLSLAYDVFPYAAGSVLFSLGYTKVLCSVMMHQGVPQFMKGKKRGWLTADYTMMPASTPVRTMRDSVVAKKAGRSIEISRLLGRVLRSIVAFENFGENTIFLDCDVVCADGGTRAAALCGMFLALRAADQYWLKIGQYSDSILKDEIAALSVGIVNEDVLVDLNCSEDNRAQADFNFFITRSEKLVEIHGGAEEQPIDRVLFNKMLDTAFSVSSEFFIFYDNHPYTGKGKLDTLICPPSNES